MRAGLALTTDLLVLSCVTQGKREMKTDLQLQRDVLGELQREPAIHAAGIGVEVQDGVVRLDGSVGAYPEKWEVEKAAQRVAGVTAVAVDLAVRIPDPEVHDDADIAHAASLALHHLALGKDGAVKVLVKDGWLELTGELAWDFQRRAIEAVLRHVAGVKGINSYLTLGPKVPVVAG
jgi:osmotically-inducible protein OsmY